MGKKYVGRHVLASTLADLVIPHFLDGFEGLIYARMCDGICYYNEWAIGCYIAKKVEEALENG